VFGGRNPSIQGAGSRERCRAGRLDEREGYGFPNGYRPSDGTRVQVVATAEQEKYGTLTGDPQPAMFLSDFAGTFVSDGAVGAHDGSSVERGRPTTRRRDPKQLRDVNSESAPFIARRVNHLIKVSARQPKSCLVSRPELGADWPVSPLHSNLFRACNRCSEVHEVATFSANVASQRWAGVSAKSPTNFRAAGHRNKCRPPVSLANDPPIHTSLMFREQPRRSRLRVPNHGCDYFSIDFKSLKSASVVTIHWI
jgi:hypothetical protein